VTCGLCRHLLQLCTVLARSRAPRPGIGLRRRTSRSVRVDKTSPWHTMAGRLILAGVAVAFIWQALGICFIFIGRLSAASHTVYFLDARRIGARHIWGTSLVSFFSPCYLGASYLIHKGPLIWTPDIRRWNGQHVRVCRYVRFRSHRSFVVCCILTSGWVAFFGGVFDLGFCRFMVPPHCAFLLVGRRFIR